MQSPMGEKEYNNNNNNGNWTDPGVTSTNRRGSIRRTEKVRRSLGILFQENSNENSSELENKENSISNKAVTVNDSRWVKISITRLRNYPIQLFKSCRINYPRHEFFNPGDKIIIRILEKIPDDSMKW